MTDIDDILVFYRMHVVPAMTSAQVVMGNFPPEILNEIRSAFTHLSRETRNPEERQQQSREAQGHLKRVVLDCYKVCILLVADRIQELIDGLELSRNSLPNSIYLEANALKARRLAVGVTEGQAPPNGTVEELAALFNDYDRFRCGIENDFGGLAAEARGRLEARRLADEKHKQRQETLRSWGMLALSSLIGLILGILGNAIYDDWKNRRSSLDAIAPSKPTLSAPASPTPRP